MPAWSKEEVYDTQIAPLMTQIIKLCHEHDLPLVMVFQYEETEDGEAGLVTTIIGSERADDQLKQLMEMAKPRRPFAIAETHVTNPDGTKTIKIERIV